MRHPATSYHTQHSPVGAFASFTLGLHSGTGGFGQSLGAPATQGIYVGYRTSAGDPWRLLPFFAPRAGSAEAAFTTAEGVGKVDASSDVAVLGPDAFGRELGWATDRWVSGPFAFALHTPWRRTTRESLRSPGAARAAFAPVVLATIELDNRASDGPAHLAFGLNDPADLWHPLADEDRTLAGFAKANACGYATKAHPEVECRQAFDLFHPKYRDHRGLHLLGPENGLVFHVPPRARRRYPIALGFFVAGPVTSGIATSYFYARLFKNLREVLAYGLRHHLRFQREAEARDLRLSRARLTAEQRWLIAQSTHSYLGSTQLLQHRGKPLWVVNEGEYRMMNTLDLTVDQLFFELEWHPWAVRNVLAQLQQRYAYRDRIRKSGRLVRGGLSFAHDMGVGNQFSLRGRSSYECDGISGCFSHMTMEQLVNWTCCTLTYAERTGDRAWLRASVPLLREAMASLQRRDDPDPRARNGILKYDSARCGDRGSEITTYDSLDVSLGQARNNFYLATKTLAAWLLLERAFRRLGLAAQRRQARRTADLLVETLMSRFERDRNRFPAVFESGSQSVILPGAEGMVFPLYLGFFREVKGRYPAFLAMLGAHLASALKPGICVDPISGAWKISSTSHNTWFSKIALAQFVARSAFPGAIGPEAARADRVHCNFQKGFPLGRNALVDQFHSSTGVDLGSRFYPRGVTACLWLLERDRTPA
jgi:hypothetical protein